MIRWQSDLPPIFFDFESQSAADLKSVGGRLYAADPTTRVLSLVCLIDGVVHVWVPSTLFDRQPPSPGGTGIGAIVIEWPQGHDEREYVTYVTPHLPDHIRHAADSRRLFVGHNVLNFDRFIWREKIGGVEPSWADTLLLARTAGLPGDLDSLATAEVGQGKDEGKRLLKKLMHRTEKNEFLDAHLGTLAGVLRYNIADVLLLEKLWESFTDLPVEADVIDVHDRINERGIRVDAKLLAKLANVSAVSVNRAGEEIGRLTDGKLTVNNLRSTKQVHEWLNTHGVYIRDYEGKASLRKNIVEQALANPWMMLDADVPIEATKDIPPEVFDVLRLRSAALRITSAKAEKAACRLSPDGRIRDLFSYWMAHTGRWSSQGVQVHNLPRPRKGIDLPELVAKHESGEWGDNPEVAYELIRSLIPGKVTVDDALSALIRPSLIPANGHVFVIADFNAVEPRCVAWMAGQLDLLQAFAGGRDVYCEFASKLYGRLIEGECIERQVGKEGIISLSYQMGVDKYRIRCGLLGIDLQKAGVTAEQVVETYRASYPKIAGEKYAGQIDGMTYRKHGLWGRLNEATFEVVSGRQQRVDVGKVSYSRTGDGTLVLTLPSGRQIRYRNARIEDRVPMYAKMKGIDRTAATLVYDSPQGERTLYGGKDLENSSQASTRDLMALAMVRLERDCGIPVVATVHDEIVTEVPEKDAESVLDTMLQVMSTVPPWAAGFPIAVEGHVAPRYYKGALPGWPKKSAKSIKPV